MKRRELTRRQLLQNSAAFGSVLLAGSVTWGFGGCSSRRSASLEAGKWHEVSPPVPAGSISPRVTQADNSVLLSWLESAVGFWLESEGGTTRLAARRVRDDGPIGAPLELARGANFGYPHAAGTAGGILVVWSERNPNSQVHAGLLQTD